MCNMIVIYYGDNDGIDDGDGNRADDEDDKDYDGDGNDDVADEADYGAENADDDDSVHENGHSEWSWSLSRRSSIAE